MRLSASPRSRSTGLNIDRPVRIQPRKSLTRITNILTVRTICLLRLADGKVESINIQEGNNPGQDSFMFAGVFQFFFLRLAIFFGCLGIFMNLFRGEILDRSLHFYFLAPIRREVLMVGKFLAGLLATCAIFVTSEILQTLAFLWHFSPSARDLYLYHNHGLEHAAVYVGVTILACVGYGAFFLVAGMLFRNPILPAAAILIWEGINPFLPAVLKQFSVIYYLKSLCPVDIPVQPGTSPVLALLVSNSDPVSAPVAVLGILIVAATRSLCIKPSGSAHGDQLHHRVRLQSFTPATP